MKLKNYLIYFVLGAGLLFSCNKGIVPTAVSGGRIKPYDTATFNYIFVEAVKQKIMGNGGDALALLEKCVEINPQSDAAYFQMAQILLAGGDIRNGKKYSLKAYSLDKKNFWYQMILAGTYYQEKNLDSAIIFYEAAVKTFPERDELKVTLGNLYSENRKFSKATAIFEGLDSKYGVNQASSAGVIKNLMWEEKYEEALKNAKELLKQYPDEILYNGLLAEIYRGMGEPGKAMEVYNELIERNPDNPEIQLALCDFLIEEEKYADLVSLLNTIIINSKITKESKIVLFGRILEIKEITGTSNNKLALSMMVLEASYPNDDIILMLRPELLISRGKLDSAAIRLNEIIIKRPDNYFAWEKLLLLYLQNGDYRNLETKGKECASKFNRSFLAKMLYATAATENKNYEVAIEELRKATILADDNEELLLQVVSLRADVYYRMKDYDKAFEAFDEAIRMNKEDMTILNNYAYYLAEQNIKLKEAEEMAKKVIDKEKTNSTFLDTYAWVLYKRGKTNEALKVMESVIKNSVKEDAEFYEHYGYILKKKKEFEKAVKNWETALKLDSSKTYLLKEIENCRK